MNLSSITTASPVLVPVRVATTAAGTLSSDFAAGDAVDGVTLEAGDRILIKNQATASENGIYTVNTSGSPILARDVIEAWRPVPGAMVFVREGTVNVRKGFMVTDDDPWTVAEHLHSTASLVRALTSFYADAPNSGTSETDAFSYSLIANTIRGLNEILEFDYTGVTTGNGSGTRRLKVVFAGTAILDTTDVVPAANTIWRLTGYIVCSAYGTGSTCSVRCVTTLTWTYPSSGTTFLVGTVITDVSSINLASAANALKLTLTSNGSSNDLTANSGVVKCATGY